MPLISLISPQDLTIVFHIVLMVFCFVFCQCVFSITKCGIALADILELMHACFSSLIVPKMLLWLEWEHCSWTVFIIHVVNVDSALPNTSKKSLSHNKGWSFRILVVLSHFHWYILMTQNMFVFGSFISLFKASCIQLPYFILCHTAATGIKLEVECHFSAGYICFQQSFFILLNSFSAVLPSPSPAEPLRCSEGWKERQGRLLAVGHFLQPIKSHFTQCSMISSMYMVERKETKCPLSYVIHFCFFASSLWLWTSFFHSSEKQHWSFACPALHPLIYPQLLMWHHCQLTGSTVGCERGGMRARWDVLP